MYRWKLILAICLILIIISKSYAEENRGIKRVLIKDKSGQQIGLYKESHAMVIGGSSYHNGWSKLPGVKKDIIAIKNALESNGFLVTTVVDPTKEQIRRAFDSFIAKYGREPENRLLIYYSGHGYTMKQTWGGNMGYIVPVDAPNPNVDKSGFLDKAIDMEMIEVYAKRIQSKHALFLFDSCFSGSIFALSKAAPAAITYKTSKPVRQFIAAGSAEEEVPDESIFRKQFIEALKGEADANKDSYVTASELGEFLQTTVINYSHNSQHPQYGKIRNPYLDKGDFVFHINFFTEDSSYILPIKPSKRTFSLDDLDEQATKEESVQRAWKEKLHEMISFFEKVQSYEKRDISTSLKLKAWRRFKKVFSGNNPYSKEDDRMLHKAESQLAYWQSQSTKQKVNYSNKSERLKRLVNYPIWVIGSKKAKGYCEKFRKLGFTVQCDVGKYGLKGAENTVQLNCPKIPDRAGQAIKNLITEYNIFIVNNRNDPDYKNNCSNFNAILVQIGSKDEM
jgi:hypothetical protein